MLDWITGTYCPMCFEKLRIRANTTIHYCKWHDCDFEYDASIKNESINGQAAIKGRISVMQQQREQIIDEIKQAQSRLATLNERIYLYEQKQIELMLDYPTLMYLKPKT